MDPNKPQIIMEPKSIGSIPKKLFQTSFVDFEDESEVDIGPPPKAPKLRPMEYHCEQPNH